MRLTQSSDAQSLSVWRQLLDELSQDRKQWQYKRGDRIPMEPAYIWVVLDGVVQLNTLYDSGDERIVGLAYPCTPFGRAFTQIDPYEAIALSKVVLLRIYQAEVEQSPYLAQNLMKALTRRLQQTEALLAISGDRRVKDRLRHLIALLHEECGIDPLEGCQFPVKLTHQQLASLLGSTRVTVTRLLNELKREGIGL